MTKEITSEFENTENRIEKEHDPYVLLKLLLVVVSIPIIIFLFYYIFNWLKRKFEVNSTGVTRVKSKPLYLMKYYR
jgi:hypothetical protein